MLKDEFTDICKLNEIVSNKDNAVYVMTSSGSPNVKY